MIACTTVLALVPGCSKRFPARGIVHGRVTLEGKPLGGATIVFENADLGVSRSAPLNDDGRYEVRSYDSVGLPVGSYTVAIVSGRFLRPGEEIPRADAAGRPPLAKPSTTVPEKYAKPGTSQLTVDVRKGDNPAFDFALDP